MKTKTRIRIRPFRPADGMFLVWGVQRDRGRDSPNRFVAVKRFCSAAVDYAYGLEKKPREPRAYGPGYPEP